MDEEMEKIIPTPAREQTLLEISNALIRIEEYLEKILSKGDIVVPVMIGDEKIDEFVIRKDGSSCWESKDISPELKQILGAIPTATLTEELEKREAVSVIYAEPDQDVKYSVNGPATVLIVTD